MKIVSVNKSALGFTRWRCPSVCLSVCLLVCLSVCCLSNLLSLSLRVQHHWQQAGPAGAFHTVSGYIYVELQYLIAYIDNVHQHVVIGSYDILLIQKKVILSSQ